SVGDAPRSRFQNIYAAPIYPELVVLSQSASKPTSTTLERAYTVFAQNLTIVDRTFLFEVANQPLGGRASFAASGAPFTDSCVLGTDCRQIRVVIPRGSSATRTVYATSTDARPRITVNVTEDVPSNPLTGSVILNGMPEDMVIQSPDDLPDL